MSPNPLRPTLRVASRRPRAEEGSAYLAVLMLLVVLTILGLSLSVITQTEVIIGGSEKQSARQLFSASNAGSIGFVDFLVARSSGTKYMVLQQRDQSLLGTTTSIGDRVCITPTIMVDEGPCNLCMMNSDSSYVAAQIGITTAALRHGDDEMAARKQIGMLVAFEPYEKSFLGLQTGGQAPIDTSTLLASTTKETDPCENMYLRF